MTINDWVAFAIVVIFGLATHKLRMPRWLNEI